MARSFMLCVAATAMLSVTSSRAEFQMVGQDAGVARRNAPAEPADAPARQQRPVMAQQAGPAPALGFGRQVPLSFAVRQVVPKGVAVTFSPDLEPDAVLVDWQGGRPWPDVLRALLRQPGLQAAFRPGAVLIRRTPA